MHDRDIKEVMEEHVDWLMSIEGVAGVAIGVLGDGSPCIKVLVVLDTPELGEKIPRELGGYRVVVEETGRITALGEEE